MQLLLDFFFTYPISSFMNVNILTPDTFDSEDTFHFKLSTRVRDRWTQRHFGPVMKTWTGNIEAVESPTDAEEQHQIYAQKESF